MPRKAKRRTLAKGVYFDGASLELRVTIGGTIITKRLPGDTPVAEAIAVRKRLVARAHTEHPQPARHTLAADIPRYLRLQTHLVSYTSRKAILAHWADRLGDRPRHRITAHDVLAARVAWLAGGTAPKTINHRTAVLGHLYAVLDGTQASTPVDEVAPLHVPRTPIHRVTDDVILAVDAELQHKAREATGNRKFDGQKTLARYRVLVSTGRRPSEVMRAQPLDVNLEQRVWVVRDGKGGWSPGLYLNDDMLAAWTLFAAADAWGDFSVSSYAKVLRRAGWPAGVRPYNARHSTWIAAVERGADMADVQVGAGHKSISTTRIYTGVRHSRMQGLSERLEGRFDGFPVVPPRSSIDK